MPLWGLLGGKGGRKKGAEESSSEDEWSAAPLNTENVRRGPIDVRRPVSSPRRSSGAKDDGEDRAEPKDPRLASQSFFGAMPSRVTDGGVILHRGALSRADMGRWMEFHKASTWKLYQSYDMTTGTILMVKEFHKDIQSPLQVLESRREIEIMRMLAGARFFPEYRADWETADRIVLVSTFMEGGTLEQAFNVGKSRMSGARERTTSHRSIRVLQLQRAAGDKEKRDRSSLALEIQSEQDVVEKIAAPLVLALTMLHGIRVLHRRISPAHVLFDDRGEARLGGLSMAIMWDEEAAISRVGQEGFMAPEVRTKPTTEELFELAVLRGIDEDSLPAYDHKADVWALGRVLLEILLRLQAGSPGGSQDLADRRSRLVSTGPGQPRPSTQMGTSVSEHASSAGDVTSPRRRHILEDATLPADVREPLSRVTAFSPEAVTFVRMMLKTDPQARPEAKLLLQTEWLKPFTERHPELTDLVAARRLKAGSLRASIQRASAELAKRSKRMSTDASRAAAAAQAQPLRAGKEDPAAVPARSSLEVRINQTSLFATYDGFQR